MVCGQIPSARCRICTIPHSPAARARGWDTKMHRANNPVEGDQG
jgi:hypothetical protein